MKGAAKQGQEIQKQMPVICPKAWLKSSSKGNPIIRRTWGHIQLETTAVAIRNSPNQH